MKLDWSEPALDDLDDVVRYISKDSSYYAREFAERVFAATDQLADFPLIGRLVPEADDKTIREVLVQSYRVMYRVGNNRVLVVAVIHGRRDLSSTEIKPWEK
jgi:toxin ParE1/3/4